MTEDFKRIVESLRVAMAIADAKGAIAFANDSFARLTGRERATLPGTSLASLFGEGDRKRIKQSITRVGEGKAAASMMDARIEGVDGWVQVALQPALGATAVLVVFLLFFREPRKAPTPVA